MLPSAAAGAQQRKTAAQRRDFRPKHRFWREGPLIKEDDWPDFNTLWDYNVYFHESGGPVTFLSGKKYTFDQWKAKGLGRHSLVADPKFVDPAKRNFSLKPDSPAFGLGFKPIDLSRVGPRKP